MYHTRCTMVHAEQLCLFTQLTASHFANAASHTTTRYTLFASCLLSPLHKPGSSAPAPHPLPKDSRSSQVQLARSGFRLSHRPKSSRPTLRLDLRGTRHRRLATSRRFCRYTRCSRLGRDDRFRLGRQRRSGRFTQYRIRSGRVRRRRRGRARCAIDSCGETWCSRRMRRRSASYRRRGRRRCRFDQFEAEIQLGSNKSTQAAH